MNEFDEDDDLEIYYISSDNEVIEKIVEDYLEDNSLEEFLEEFDITPAEAVTCLFNSGLIDENDLQRFKPID